LEVSARINRRGYGNLPVTGCETLLEESEEETVIHSAVPSDRQ